MNWNPEIRFLRPLSKIPWNSSELVQLLHNDCLRPLQKTRHLLDPSMSRFRGNSMILKMSSPRYPLTTYQTENHGIMLSNWNWEQKYLQQRSIHYPQTSKQSLTFSLKRI